MAPSIYLINPKPDFPTYYSAEVFGAWAQKPAILIADLAVTAVAAMAPRNFHVTLCDENVTPVDFNSPADFIGITGKVSQWERMKAIAREFREKRGKIVLMGGPNVSLSPEAARPHCDILVRGEAEDISAQLFADLASGSWRSEYVGTKPDLRSCPQPRWDLYPNQRTFLGTVQTSRGCPFECEFCDVIQYLGRKQRHKPPSQVLSELDRLYELGYRRVFLADDNFTVERSKAKELLDALRSWNRARPAGHVHFTTQVSIDAARDDELLRMCAEAGLVQVFIGIETPNLESLRETKKRQNLKRDLRGDVERFLEFGISVNAGMIVGFDADEHDIFDRQFEFAMSTPIPLFSLGALVASAATPLYDRLARAGRLAGREDGSAGVPAAPWETNIVPAGMSRDQLLEGARNLCNSLYAPAAFGERVLRYIRLFGARRDPGREAAMMDLSRMRDVDVEGMALLSQLSTLSREDRLMWGRVRAALNRRPELTELVVPLMIQYLQVRFMYQQAGVSRAMSAA